MKVFLDTNLLVAASIRQHPHHARADEVVGGRVVVAIKAGCEEREERVVRRQRGRSCWGVMVDTSVIVAALDETDPDHGACRRVMLAGTTGAWSHALSESFSVLTGGKLGFRLSAPEAAGLLRDFVAPRLELVFLSETELLDAYGESRAQRPRTVLR